MKRFVLVLLVVIFISGNLDAEENKKLKDVPIQKLGKEFQTRQQVASPSP